VSAQPDPLPAPAGPTPSSVRAWALAVRPRTLTASLIPVVVGSAVAWHLGTMQPAILLACLLAALLLQVAANLLNDALDFLKGIDTEVRLGPQRVTQAGLLSASSVLRAGALSLAMAVCVGTYLVWVGGPVILIIGASAALLAAAYSAGPFPLASHALGELVAFLFFGVIAITGTAYLHTGSFSGLALLTSIPIGLLVSDLMLVNNLRDIESDRAVGKRTLAVRLGASRTRFGYITLLTLAYLSPPFLWLWEPALPGVFLPWFSLPLAVSLSRQVRRAREGSAFNRALVGTALLHMVFGILLAAGLLW
jgi:1,4-dihydroxy-2-naphthoate octaprenyltransferase